jgi:hypothetical protein
MPEKKIGQRNGSGLGSAVTNTFKAFKIAIRLFDKFQCYFD